MSKMQTYGLERIKTNSGNDKSNRRHNVKKVNRRKARNKNRVYSTHNSTHVSVTELIAEFE